MSAFGARAQRQFSRWVRKGGKEALLQAVNHSDDATEPWEEAVTPPAAGYESPVRVKFSNFKDDQIDGDLIRSVDTTGFISPPADGVEPTNAHRLIVGAKAYEIVAVKTIGPDEAVLLYRLHLRGSE